MARLVRVLAWYLQSHSPAHTGHGRDAAADTTLSRTMYVVRNSTTYSEVDLNVGYINNVIPCNVRSISIGEHATIAF
jgi:hypothetical protein